MVVADAPDQSPSGIDRSTRLKLLRWSLMAAAVFWTLLFRMGMQAAEVPEFVYVNF